MHFILEAFRKAFLMGAGIMATLGFMKGNKMGYTIAVVFIFLEALLGAFQQSRQRTCKHWKQL